MSFGILHVHANAIKTDGRMGGLAKIERCKNRERDFAKAKDGWTLHLFQGAWFEPFGQHVFGDA